MPALGYDEPRPMTYAIKTPIADTTRDTYTFHEQKTMYGGKKIRKGGSGLFARAVVTSATPTPPLPDVDRQTPRVSIRVTRVALAKRPLGRRELKRFSTWDDGRPETELNFKFYRQATNKIVGLTDDAAAFLDTFF